MISALITKATVSLFCRSPSGIGCIDECGDVRSEYCTRPSPSNSMNVQFWNSRSGIRQILLGLGRRAQITAYLPHPKVVNAPKKVVRYFDAIYGQAQTIREANGHRDCQMLQNFNTADL